MHYLGQYDSVWLAFIVPDIDLNFYLKRAAVEVLICFSSFLDLRDYTSYKQVMSFMY